MVFEIPRDKIEHRHYINGEFCESSDKNTFALYSPYTHEKVVDVCEASIEDVDRAVAAAKAAFPAWAAKSPVERGALLKKLAAKVRELSSELAQLNAVDYGRPVSTYHDAYFGARWLDHISEAGYDAQGTTSLNTPGFVNMSFRQPAGPIAAVIPWNIPTTQFCMKAGAALAAGCTVVLKSSEKAPLTPARIAHYAHEIGFPPGVLNVLSGHGTPSGAALASHMDIRVITFTGSTTTGRKIQAAAASSNLKKVVLELGGKSPALVFEDADIPAAVKSTAASISMNSGQACFANSRIYVHESIASEFKAEFVKLYSSTKQGDPLDPATRQGPQADALQHERIISYLDAAAKQKSGTLLSGGRSNHVNGTGYFIEPTVYADVAEHERTMREEIFGPFVNINTFKTEEEVLAKANDSEYGLYASVFTRDLSRAMRLAKAFESGLVGINCAGPHIGIDMPFGGYKMSGSGREGYKYSLDEFLEHKTVVIKLDEAGGAH